MCFFLHSEDDFRVQNAALQFQSIPFIWWQSPCYIDEILNEQHAANLGRVIVAMQSIS